MNITLIAAKAENNEIGGNNDLLWDLPDDMTFFKETTKGFPVVMGRKNYFSIPHKFRPLPHRDNIVLTSDQNLTLDKGVYVVHSVEETLTFCKEKGYAEVFIIGGGEIYRQFIGMASRLLITEVRGTFDKADTYFPEIDANRWVEVSRKHHPKDAKHDYAFDFVTLKTKRQPN